MNQLDIQDNSFKKKLLRAFGFSKGVRRIETGLCPFCGTPIKLEDFRDELSIRECNISGLCQTCQDGIFGK